MFGSMPEGAEALPLSDPLPAGKASACVPAAERRNLRMKAARAALGPSQSDLAAAVGVTRQTIGLIEAGGYNPTLNLCVAICKTLHATLDDLFWEEGAEQ